jgi:hypothetical protein
MNNDGFAFTKEDEINFWNSVIKTYLEDGKEHCWLWKGHTNTLGYGTFSNSSNTKFAHRFSVQLHGKIIPEKLVINHKCETRNCVNPSHLNIMSQKTNVNLRGKEQSLDDEDEIYENEVYEKASPLTDFQMCLRRLEESFMAVGRTLNPISEEDVGKLAVSQMIKIKLMRNSDDFSFELCGEETIDGYKRKYFWYFDEILNDYDVQFKLILEHYEID